LDELNDGPEDGAISRRRAVFASFWMVDRTRGYAKLSLVGATLSTGNAAFRYKIPVADRSLGVYQNKKLKRRPAFTQCIPLNTPAKEIYLSETDAVLN